MGSPAASGVHPLTSITVMLRKPNRYGLINLVPHWSMPEGVDGTHAFHDSGVVVGRCNATHQVRYMLGTPEAEAQHRPEVVVYDDNHGNRRGVDDDLGTWNGSVRLYLMQEPPALGYHRERAFPPRAGFHGLVSYHRNASVWLPFHPPSQVWSVARYGPLRGPALCKKLGGDYCERPRLAPHDHAHRRGVAIWLDNCGIPSRNALIDELYGSGVPIFSYGKCKGNQGAKLQEVRHNTAEGRAVCTQHRLMFAVENHACHDYISRTLYEAVAVCGAIPIVATHRGVPDYDGALGPIPRVDASAPGWLDEVRAIALNDTHYAAVLRGWRRRAPGEIRGAKDEPDEKQRVAWEVRTARSYHCQWHELLRSGGARRRPRKVSWGGPCLASGGERAERP
jgi:hypothetical protein